MNRINRRCAFTLIEMLAALSGIVVVVGASSGFLITAILRQKAVLEASQLEAAQSGLAQIMKSAIKTADRFQLYLDRADFEKDPIGPGVPNGNFLACSKVTPQGEVYQYFEYRNGSPQGEVVYKRTALGSLQATEQVTTDIQPADANGNPADYLFAVQHGIVVASWGVTSRLDWIPYRVWAIPLTMK